MDATELLALLSNPPRGKAVYSTGQGVPGPFTGWKLSSSYRTTVGVSGIVVEVPGLYRVDYNLGQRYKAGATSSYGQTFITVDGVRQNEVGSSGQQGLGQAGAMVTFGGHTYLELQVGQTVGVEMVGTAIVPTPGGSTGPATWLTVEYWSPGKA